MSFYGTLSDANTYHSDRGNTAWAAASEEERNAALLRGSDYIDQRYMRRLGTGAYVSMFPGIPNESNTNGRQWPRDGAVDGYGRAIASDVIPEVVQRATYEAAIRELANPGSLSPDFVPGDKVIHERVGKIQTSYAMLPTARKDDNSNRPVVPQIDEILAILLQGGSSTLGVAVNVV